LPYKALAEKSGNMFDFHGNTSSTRAGAWSWHVFSLIFPTTQQSHAFSMSPGTSPIAASGATNVENPAYRRQKISRPMQIVARSF
jgi:hypothetical protein